jgi:hypothetical protein
VKTICLTSDKGNWCLPAFLHQWQKYDRRPITVVGFTDPGGLPAPFVSIGRFADYPLARWSDAVIKYLASIPDDLVEIWLEDYWLIRKTNREMVELAGWYMVENPDVLRFDLSTDRLYAKTARDVESIGCMDVIEAKGEYSLSWQVNIWRRSLLLEMLCAGENPWESELYGTQRVNASPYRVLGSRQSPVRYMIAVNKGQLDRSGAWMFPPRTLCDRDWAELDRLGYTRQG